MALLQTVFVYTIACITGVYIAIRLAIRYITNPSAFPVKKRDKPPTCLTDPEHGNHGYLSLKGIKIHYVEKGDRSKPLMLFIHGFPEFWYSWRYQMKEFSKDYWTVAIDMRGYGDSEKPSGVNNYSMQYLVDDIKHVVEALGRQKVIIVAHDWGGAIAWEFILKYHEMVDRYIIMDAPYSPAFYEVVKTNPKQFISSLYMCFFQLPYLPELFLSSFDFRGFRRLFRGKTPKSPLTVTDEDIEAFKYNISKPEGLTPPLNYYRATLLRRLPRPSPRKLEIEARGLLIFGELDDFLVLDHVTVSQKYVKNLEGKIVKGANHFVQQDDPDTVNRYMREFLEKN